VRFFYFSSQEVISGLPDTDKFTLLSSRSHLTERTKHGCALLLSSPSEHVSALDLVAVLALRELLEVRLVLGRHEGVRHLGDSVVLEPDVLGEASDLAGDPLHALLALHHRHVDVVHALNHVV